MTTTETYTHEDRQRMQTTLHDLGDVACAQVMDSQTRDALACYVTVEQARAMAEWLTAWADSREDER